MTGQHPFSFFLFFFVLKERRQTGNRVIDAEVLDKEGYGSGDRTDGNDSDVVSGVVWGDKEPHGEEDALDTDSSLIALVNNGVGDFLVVVRPDRRWDLVLVGAELSSVSSSLANRFNVLEHNTKVRTLIAQKKKKEKRNERDREKQTGSAAPQAILPTWLTETGGGDGGEFLILFMRKREREERNEP